MPAPGVVVTTSTAPGPSSTSQAPASTYMAVGQMERGAPNTPILIHSPAEYQQKCGNPVTYSTLWYDIVNFFLNGGLQAYLVRIVGPGATTGTLTLNDQAGSPLPTLTVSATSPGAWSSQIQVQIDPGQVTNTFTLSVIFNGVVVRRYANLASPAAAVAATAQDPYIVVAQVADVTAAPQNNPATRAATALSAGTDDRASISTSTYTAALANFTADLGTGAVAIPGQPIDNVGTAIKAHCQAFGRIGITAGAQGVSAASIQASAAPLVGTAGGEYIGVFYPWVKVGDGFGNVLTISPEGYVAGVRARAHLAEGPGRAPAGSFAAAANLLGTDIAVDDTTGATLDNNNVSAIRVIDSTVQIYGYQSLSTDTANYPLLTDRDFLNYVAWQAKQIMKPYVFRTVDGNNQFFGAMQADIRGFLESLRNAGEIYPKLDASGALVDNGYTIDVGPDVNPLTQLAQNIVAAKVEVRKSPTAKLINVGVVKVALTASL